MHRNVSLFEDQRMGFKDAIELSLASLREYGALYQDWAVAYSGGKDSSATASFVVWAVQQGLVDPPNSLTIVYADTRQELPPLHATAMQFLAALRADGVQTRVVLPELDLRYYVYMLGRGVPPPNNRTLRWCTRQIKIDPMAAALDELGEKYLMMTGVRLGESAARDARIAVSCSTDKGECGQGWFEASPESATLSPIVHWRLCFVWDWLYFANDDRYMQTIGYAGGHHYDMIGEVAVVYGDDEARTGCIGCPLAERETALENVLTYEQWAHLKPLLELKALFRELREPQYRLRKAEPEILKDGSLSKSGQRMGPLTMEARAYGLERVLDIQARARVDLINNEEEARIRELWALNTWPERWTGDEPVATVPLDKIAVIEGQEIVTRLLL